MPLAIIILSGDTPEILFRCLAGIKDNVRVEYKIYLAYNGQRSEVEEEIRSFFERNFSARHFKVIKYGFYNFAVLNNDVVKNHLDLGTEYVLFCNNDVIINSECINQMVSLLMCLPDRIGTVGCRLLYENGLIQHDGQCIFVSRSSSFRTVSHINIGLDPKDLEYTECRLVVGNTFALCLCRVDVFKAVGLLNEGYQVCFEDVEINLKFLQRGYKNVVLPSRFSALHLESYSREKTPHKRKFLESDFLLLRHFFQNQFMNGQDLLVRTEEVPPEEHPTVASQGLGG